MTSLLDAERLARRGGMRNDCLIDKRCCRHSKIIAQSMNHLGPSHSHMEKENGSNQRSDGRGVWKLGIVLWKLRADEISWKCRRRRFHIKCAWRAPAMVTIGSDWKLTSMLNSRISARPESWRLPRGSPRCHRG